MQPAASTIALTIYAGHGLSPALPFQRAMISRVSVPKARPAGPSELPGKGEGWLIFDVGENLPYWLPKKLTNTFLWQLGIMSDSTTSPSRYAIIRFHKYKTGSAIKKVKDHNIELKASSRTVWTR